MYAVHCPSVLMGNLNPMYHARDARFKIFGIIIILMIRVWNPMHYQVTQGLKLVLSYLMGRVWNPLHHWAIQGLILVVSWFIWWAVFLNRVFTYRGAHRYYLHSSVCLWSVYSVFETVSMVTGQWCVMGVVTSVSISSNTHLITNCTPTSLKDWSVYLHEEQLQRLCPDELYICHM